LFSAKYNEGSPFVNKKFPIKDTPQPIKSVEKVTTDLLKD